MKASRMTEEQVYKLVAEVSAAAKMTPPRVLTDASIVTGSFWIGPVPIVNLNYYEILEGEFSDRDLKGIVAHELGHLALRHSQLDPSSGRPQAWQVEFSADDFAARSGFRNELIGSLRSSIAALRNPQDAGKDSYSHPSLNRRIANLKSSGAQTAVA